LWILGTALPLSYTPRPLLSLSNVSSSVRECFVN
jgi:hypothetical protein